MRIDGGLMMNEITMKYIKMVLMMEHLDRPYTLIPMSELEEHLEGRTVSEIIQLFAANGFDTSAPFFNNGDGEGEFISYSNDDVFELIFTWQEEIFEDFIMFTEGLLRARG